jgi:hypothetical protein
MKEAIKITVIATGFEHRESKRPTTEEIRTRLTKSQPAVPVNSPTPPYVFEPKGNQEPFLEAGQPEPDWNEMNIPAFMRKMRQAAIRKTPNDLR